MSKDQECAKVIREMIYHENTLQNYRITWLITIQGLLLAALGFAWDKTDATWLVYVFAFIGTAVGLSSWAALHIGHNAFHMLTEWWKKEKQSGVEDYKGPPVVGYDDSVWYWFMNPWHCLPWLFVVAWLAIAAIRFVTA